MDLSIMKQEVTTWLTSIFEDEAVPEFEVNSETISELHALLQMNKNQNRNKAIVIEDLKHKAKEYNAEAQRIGKVLSRMNLGVNTLPQACATNLRTLSRAAVLLEAKNSSDSYLYASISDLDDRFISAEFEKEKIMEEIQNLKKKNLSLIVNCDNLRSSLEKLKLSAAEEEPKVSIKASKKEFFDEKAQQYRKDIKKLQAKLAKTGFTENVYHHKLVEKYEKLKEVESKLSATEEELKSFAGVPLDMMELKMQIVQKKKDLDEIRKATSNIVDSDQVLL